MSDLNAANAGTAIKQEVQGQGFWQSISIPLMALDHSADSAPTLSSGVETWTLDADSESLVWSDVLPCNYDNLRDGLVLEVLASCTVAGSTSDDYLTIDTLKYWRAGASAVASATVTGISKKYTSDTTTAQLLTFDLSSLGLRPGDAVNVALGVEVSTGAFTIYGFHIRYRGNFTKTTVGAAPADR